MCIFVKVYERRDTTNDSFITNKPKKQLYRTIRLTNNHKKD